MASSDDPKQYIASGYDRSANEYLAWAKSRSGAMEHRLDLVEQLHKFLGSAEPGHAPHRRLRLLELGCGAGEPVTLALAAHSAISDVIANDISRTQLNMLGDKLAKLGLDATGAKVELVHGDMMSLDYEGGSLDAVLAFYSVIHLSQNEQPELVSRIHRWLKPGSGYFLTCFGAEENAGATNDNWLGMKSFWSSHGTEKSLGMVEAAGFEIVYKDVTNDPEDAPFLWVIGRKKGA